ncbi:hypothetical protein TSAR_001365 [Trichomalopsis sarcophagae]|uniref:Nucleolar protein 6 n=1 Tax=Trichomalopsis sarcophagae TaxID=543379 RepID=A0A232EL17_9HYME|nr:hypothetical protein TSAR_001365 [Trichomalopsis sarcophagae]
MIDHKKQVVDPESPTEMDSEADEDLEERLEKQKPLVKINKKRKNSENDDPSAKKKGKVEKGLYKQPTVEELNQLRETENLFHSNLFRLQIEEILSAVKLKSKYQKLFEAWYEKFETHVKSIKGTKELSLEDNTLFNKFNVKIPMAKLPNDCVGTLKYSPPSSITVAGSYALETIVGPEASIDILIEMPENLFSKIDSKNYRYMRKKAIYLAYITSKIGKDLAETKSFIGNHSNPILKIVPTGKLGSKFVVHVHVVVQETSLPPNKFTPEKNNVKPNWFFKATDKNTDNNPPTPYYNSAILHDLTALKANTQNVKLIKEYPNIRDGIVLLKIWLKQREFCNNYETFNGHVITMYVLYLLLTKKLNTFMSSYQIVRNTWQHLANSNWCKEGISLCQDEKIAARIAEYHKHYDCVFLDFTGYYNIAANIQEDVFRWVSNQAAMSIECLNNTRVNGFQVLFMRKVPFYKAVDFVICLHNVKALENILDVNSDESDKLNYGPNKYVPIIKLISTFLKQGLGQRASFVCSFPRKLREWQTNEEIPNDLERIYIGLKLDPHHAFNIIEKGPGANLPEAEAFRKFWGHKSELRRFKDGTICEAVVWAKPNATLAQKRDISQRISKYLLEEKLKLFEKAHYFFFSNQLEEFLKLKKVKVRGFHYGPEEAALQVINTFAGLEKDLSNLTDLPLSINGLQGCSPLFRYTDVFPPLATVRKTDDKNVLDTPSHLRFVENGDVDEVPMYLAPVEVTMQLSTSGKWPDDLQALRMTKAAFHLQIAQSIRKQCKIRAQGCMHYIDVMKDGLVFRIRIANQREIGLVKQQVDEDGVTKYRDNEESLELEKNLFHLPKITGALYGLYCQQPSFGPACCLAKRWLAAQLIDDSHMPDIAVELLVASMYLNSDPYEPTTAPQVAFLRFLESFAREHWSTDPIIVNFNNEMTREEIVEIENTFGTSRETLPSLFICTPYDREASIWTRKAPTPIILKRISALAKEALRLLEVQLFSETSVCCDPLFNPPLSAYDCLIQLKESLNPRKHEATAIVKDDLPTKDLYPFKEHSKTRIPIVGFDPVAEYLSELRKNYSEHALFFHDTYGGNVVGVLLKPQAMQQKDFKVSNTSCQKFNDNQKLILNVSAMIEDFYILGKGLVEIINIQSDKLKAL